jgi:hypothetical protein
MLPMHLIKNQDVSGVFLFSLEIQANVQRHASAALPS